MAYTTCTVPQGEKISIQNGTLTVPNQPIIPFIRGDGTGPDIWASSVRVMDAAVEKAFGGSRKISWMASSGSTTGSPTTPSTRSASSWWASRVH